MNNVIDMFAGKRQSAPVEGDSVRAVAPSIGDTAAGQAVAALQFYANQGFDHGVRARAALLGMFTVIDAKEKPVSPECA